MGAPDDGGLPDAGLPDAPVFPDGPSIDAPVGPDAPTFDGSPIDGPPAGIAAHLLLTEIVVAPAAAEMIEIYNPTNAPVALANYYISDRADYYTIVTGTLPAVASDFAARFPAGAQILPGEYQTIALHGATMFMSTYGVTPTYEMVADSATVPDLLPAVSGAIGTSLSLTDGGEPVILFFWDQTSDLVKDVDYVFYGAATTSNPLVNKTGISVDGPDTGTTATMFAADSATQTPIGTHQSGGSIQRCKFDELGETATGGNGLVGHNETSEPMMTNWKVNASSTALRTPNAGPPVGFCP
jgi:Lamin Tail Domain